MEAQLYRTNGRDYDGSLHPAGEHKDEAQTVNDSPVVRSGLAQPTVMGTPVLAEDLYATHSDITDTPVRSFAQWEDEERRGAPPPLSTAYETHLTDMPHGGHHTYSGDVDREQFKGSIGKHTFLEEESYGAPLPPSTGTDPSPVGDRAYGDEDLNREEREFTNVPNPRTAVSPANRHCTVSGGKEVGITEVLHSFDKMKVFNEPETKSSETDQTEPNVYTGSHDQFAPEPVENPSLDTISANPSNPNSSYTQRISSAASAVADKAVAVKDSVLSKLSSSKGDTGSVSHKTNYPTVISHKVADTLSSTLGPVYEKVAEVGSSVTSKKHGPGPDDVTENMETKTEGKGVTVKEYLADTFKPGDDDKVLSEVITHAFHRGKGKQPQQETSTTTYVIRDEGERRLQDSGS